jgi:hypothetical protein
VVSGRSRGKGKTLYIDENAAEWVAHVVFVRRCTPEARKKIRNNEFSDLSGNRQNKTAFLLDVYGFNPYIYNL